MTQQPYKGGRRNSRRRKYAGTAPDTLMKQQPRKEGEATALEGMLQLQPLEGRSDLDGSRAAFVSAPEETPLACLDDQLPQLQILYRRPC